MRDGRSRNARHTRVLALITFSFAICSGGMSDDGFAKGKCQVGVGFVTT